MAEHENNELLDALVSRMDARYIKMDSAGSSDIWRQNIEKNVGELGNRLDRGIASLSTMISENQKLTDNRMQSAQERSDAKFQALQDQNLAALGAKSSAQWQIFAYIGSALISIAGLGAVFWGLTKAPIDDAFMRQERATVAIVADLKETTKTLGAEIKAEHEGVNERLKEYEPKAQILDAVSGLQKTVDDLSKRVNATESGIVLGVQDRSGIRVEIARIMDDLKTIHEDYKANIVPRSENENRWTDIQARINSLFERINNVQSALGNGNGVGDRLNNLSRELSEIKNKFFFVPPSLTPSGTGFRQNQN